MKTYSPALGHNVRGFMVLISAPGRRPTTLPATGEPYYTGEQAAAVMERYRLRRPGVETAALTDGAGGRESLTLEEMQAIFVG
jgi:hypothetical protein